MDKKIYINLQRSTDSLSIPYSTQGHLDGVYFNPTFDKIVLEVTNFPNVLKTALKGIQPVVQSNIGMKMVTQSLVIDVDPFELLSDMDDETLGDLDIKEIKEIYSIN